MTDNEIIKALECCCEAELKEDCKKLKCPFFDNEIYNCVNVDDENAMYRYSLDLINRQKAKIERLQAKCENTQVGYNFAKAETEEYKAINKSLKADRPFLIANAKSEAIKEFAERLKELKTQYSEEDIDELVKELTGV